MRHFLVFFAMALGLSGQEIVFTHAPEGGPPVPVQDVYSMDGDGSNVKGLTDDGHSHNPVWSPDGRRVLFVHDTESNSPVELYVMDRDGGNRHLLRRLETPIFSVAWSPDGATLAITLGSHTESGAGLFLLPASGEGEPRLVLADAFTPAWSPDGKKLAFSLDKPRGLWSVHVANVEGSGDIALTEANMAGSPSWSPDGKQIAFAEGAGRQDIFVMDLDGSHRRQITMDNGWSCDHPSWSPDGARLVFSCQTSFCGAATGPVVQICDRGIFSAPISDPKRKPVRLGNRDGRTPEVAPVP